MSSWRCVFILQEDGTKNTPDEHVCCIEMYLLHQNVVRSVLYMFHCKTVASISELNQQHSLAVDIFTFKIECYLEYLNLLSVEL